MLKRCIMIFPKFDNIEMINEIRCKYDPLANHVQPHITLVFPFDSDIATPDLKEHMYNVLKDFSSFEILLSTITPTYSFGRYLFLNIKKGNSEIIKMHERLYTGILGDYYPKWLCQENFLPHMTVGSFEDDESFKIGINDVENIQDEFKTVVNEISVEIIDENEDSIIEFTIPLS
ncbi:MAG: 2'-5' RNA ligase family protein [Romboutsia sp.]|uniref:2'-5' RNA ligase family protein n=1 Tax=Romboutsia sp. TaxID=1965302 RepID=UPI003F33A493